MAKMKDILKGIRYSSGSDLTLSSIRNITDNSKKVGKGYLFVASRGQAQDGYRFIDEAIERGASAVISDRDFMAPSYVEKIIVKNARAVIPILADNFYANPSGRLKIVGVTGTNGKTTITYLLESILDAANKRSGVIGTINYRIKDKKMPSPNTTPGPIELNSLLRKMLDSGVGYVLMEVSSHSLDQGRVDQVYFDVGIFTNITKEHLDYHKTLQRYFIAKTKLFKKLKKNATAVLNRDDKMVYSLKNAIGGKVVTYGMHRGADIRAERVNLSIDSSDFIVRAGKVSFDIRTGLIGRHNISNILASTAAAFALGIKADHIKKGIESFKNVPGRLEAVSKGQPFKIFVDYAHTEDALYNVLSLLKDTAGKGRIITVFGCGGNRDRSKRPKMGRVACSLSDRVVVTSDNPRFEDPNNIISEIEKGIRNKFKNYDVVPDRKKAIEKALRMAREGDAVIIAGKGHEKHQIINGNTLPFDDCQVAASIIKDML